MDPVHELGPWGGPWTRSMDPGVVYGPRSMFCIRAYMHVTYNKPTFKNLGERNCLYTVHDFHLQDTTNINTAKLFFIATCSYWFTQVFKINITSK